MTKKQWIDLAKQDLDLLADFVGKWHPGSPTRKPDHLLITAHNAEASRAMVAPAVAAEGPADPVMAFREAVARGDVEEVVDILNGAWLGVPESTECWSVPGFSQAVNLLEDPPE